MTETFERTTQPELSATDKITTAFVRKVAALPCARVDGDECCFFEKELAKYCVSCHAKELLERTAPSDRSVKAAAEEINNLAISELGRQFYGPVFDRLVAILSKHLGSAAVGEQEGKEQG